MKDDWQSLEQLWQSDVPAAAPAREVIERQRRRRWRARLMLAGEVAITLIGSGIIVATMGRNAHFTLVLGSAALVLLWFAAGLSLWARLLHRTPQPELSVLATLDDALHRARVGVRWGLASLWIMVPYLLFVALAAFVWSGPEEYTAEAVDRLLRAFSVWALWGALCQAWGILYYARRLRELTTLEEFRRVLAESP